MSYKEYILPLVAISKHWKLKPLQLILMLIGLTTATALWNSVYLINNEAKQAYSDAQIISSISTKKKLVSKSSPYLNDKFFGELRREGWIVTPQLVGEIKGETAINGDIIKVIGIDPLSIDRKIVTNSLPIELSPGEFLLGTRVIVSGPKTAKFIKRVTSFNTVRVSNNFPEGYVLTDISIAQQILNKKQKLSSLEIVGSIPDDLKKIHARGLKIQLNESDIDLDSLTKSFHLNLTAFGFLSYIVGLFIVYSTISLAFEQRRGILRGLRSLGLSTISLTGLLLFEILLISFVSGVLGVIASYLLATTLLPDVAVTLNGLFGANLKNSLSLNGMFWVSSIGVATFGALCASAPALWKMLSLSPIDSAKRIVWYEKTKANLKYQLSIVAILVLFIIYLLKFGTGIMNAFFLLGATLISTTLLLPIFLWLVLSLILKINFKRPLIKWFFADSKQQINSLSVSLMALLIALAINIGVGGMVESFRKTFDGWLDQRLASELYIQVSNTEASVKLKQLLDGKVDAILPIVKVSQNLSEIPTDIFGFIPHQTYSEHWPLLVEHETTWLALEQNKGMIVNEQLARRLNLSIFQMIEFQTKSGQPVQLEILGIYSDYGNPKGQIMLPFELFNLYFPNEPQLSFAVRIEKTSVPKILESLNQKFPRNDIVITDQVAIKNLSTKIFEKTFAITTALSALTLSIAGMALFTAITTLSDNRNSQLAPLWSIGTKQKTLALLEILRSISLSMLTFIFAVPIGLVVVFILTNYVNLEAFGWKLPIFYFPMQWVSLSIVTILITLISTFFYSVKLTKSSPAELLKASQYDT